MRQPLYFLFSLALLFTFLPKESSLAQEPFEDCSSNSDNNATVLVTTEASVDIGTGYSLEEGDTIASLTGDGACAGSAVWEGTNLAMSIAGQDETGGIDGYESGETLNFSVYHQAAGEIIEADVSYEPCSEDDGLCNDEGIYVKDALYELSANLIPVELTSFTITQHGSSALLQWSTASEINNAGFEVHHQPAGSSTWVTQDFVEGNGTSSQPQHYSFRTDELEAGSHRFRLYQFDFDGSTEYHPPQELRVELAEAVSITGIHPNPVSTYGSFSISVAESQQVQVEVFNQLGQQVDLLFDGVIPNSATREVDVYASNYASGVYLIRINGDSFSEVLNLVVVQ